HGLATPRSPSGGAGRGRRSLTQTGYLPGTPFYIAPELVEGPEALSPAADLFALGILAFELLVGERPFPGSVALALLEEREPPPALRLRARWPDAPAELDAALDACLRFDPEARPTAAELAALLDRLGETRAVDEPGA
ncbi:MAG TPA: protein kinase, partial [Polyangiaceae bacterium LLY-WYZ-15_(1-7)]|nr:protein kinase [Polyangiaceae bacterium LLY-WYZ-15_(1-7)]